MLMLGKNITGWQIYIILKVICKGHGNQVIKRYEKNRDAIYVRNIFWVVKIYCGGEMSVEYQNSPLKLRNGLILLSVVTSPCAISSQSLQYPASYFCLSFSFSVLAHQRWTVCV